MSYVVCYTYWISHKQKEDFLVEFAVVLFYVQVDFEITPTQAERGEEKEQREDHQQEGPQSLASDVPETMTPDEAENLLSSR